MKTIIAGSRDIRDVKTVFDAIEASDIEVTEVFCGGAEGVDTIGRMWAYKQGIPVREFPADWKGLGRAAGAARNREMAKHAEALILVWDGSSSGSYNMLKEALARDLEVFVLVVRE